MPLFFDIFIEKEIDSMTKVKALNRDGKITWCTAKNPGTGTCNHILHKTEGISDEEFQQQVDRYNEKMNRLLYSNNIGDRVLCAGQGYGLDILEKDPDYHVRREVAQQGHNPALFAIDYDYFTRSVAQDYIDKEKDEKLKKKYQEQLDSYIHGTMAQKLACVNAEIGLDELVKDENELVRREVASKGYKTDILVKDPSPNVRIFVALRKEHHDTLSHDKDENVRAAVASCCDEEILHNLALDKSPLVRQRVAIRGNLLSQEEFNKLLNDEDFHVRETAKLVKRKE